MFKVNGLKDQDPVKTSSLFLNSINSYGLKIIHFLRVQLIKTFINHYYNNNINIVEILIA